MCVLCVCVHVCCVCVCVCNPTVGEVTQSSGRIRVKTAGVEFVKLLRTLRLIWGTSRVTWPAKPRFSFKGLKEQNWSQIRLRGRWKLINGELPPGVAASKNNNNPEFSEIREIFLTKVWSASRIFRFREGAAQTYNILQHSRWPWSGFNQHLVKIRGRRGSFDLQTVHIRLSTEQTTHLVSNWWTKGASSSQLAKLLRGVRD